MNKHTLVKFANVDHQLVFQFGREKLSYDLGRSLEDAGRVRTNIQPRLEISGSGKLTLSHVAVFRDIHYTTGRETNGPPYSRAIDKPFALGQDEFFVLGDNSPNSADSRLWSEEGLANKGRPPLLFSVELEFKSDLYSRIISEELRQKFKENQILLSQHVTVLVKRENTWVITDKLKVYFVREEEEENRLNIYLSPYRAGIVPRDYLVGKALFVYWPSGFRPFPTFPIGIISNIGRMRFIYGGSNEKL
jgi:hypothetical protein